VIGVPSEQVIPSRSVKVVDSGVASQEAARPGTGPLSSMRTRVSKLARASMKSGRDMPTAGSKVAGMSMVARIVSVSTGASPPPPPPPPPLQAVSRSAPPMASATAGRVMPCVMVCPFDVERDSVGGALVGNG
jgi:hypothetical protein